MPPIYMNLCNKFSPEKSIENNITKTREAIIWINNKENKFFAHILKKLEVLFRDKDKIAKGASKANTLIIIYLKEYDKVNPKREKDKVPLISPSKEKIFKEDVFNARVEFILVINSEKQIFLLKIFSPTFFIAIEI